MKRRDLLLAMGLAPMVAPLSIRTAQASEKKENDESATEIVNLLFVQSAHGAELENGKLRLKGINPSTILFSDRPQRFTGHEPTEDFVKEWGEGEDSFKVNNPNATLSILTGPEPQEIVMVLKSVKMDNKDLIYDVEILDGAKSAKGGASSLFIDTLGRPMSPGSIAGVHRRKRRRRRRHVRNPGPGPR